jgi:hypothetical protein
MKFSEGPWTVTKVQKADITPSGIRYYDEKVSVVADARGYVIAEHSNHDDAALIASAPEMLAVLREAMARSTCTICHDDLTHKPNCALAALMERLK